MANRRMFSKSITSSSQFLMMPQSSQNLYFHLGMNADDDGFCEHFAIMRMTDSKPDDLKVLQAKGFVKVFDDRVLVISDWKENNYLRSDRYTPSKYLEIYKEELKGLVSGIPTVSKMDTQVRLGKDRLGKVRKESIDFEEFWKLYPKKVEKLKASQKWDKLPLEVQNLILKDIPLRLKGLKWSKSDGQFIENPLTYLNGERWNDVIEQPKELPTFNVVKI